MVSIVSHRDYSKINKIKVHMGISKNRWQFHRLESASAYLWLHPR